MSDYPHDLQVEIARRTATGDLVKAFELKAPPVCHWHEDDGGIWEAKCGPRYERMFEFVDGGPDENGFAYCPYCGKKLVPVPFNIHNEDDE